MRRANSDPKNYKYNQKFTMKGLTLPSEVIAKFNVLKQRKNVVSGS